MASRKSFLSIPGFYTNKKVGKSGQTQVGPQTQPQKPPPAEAWELPPKLPPKITENIVNHTSNSPSEVTSSISDFLTPSILVPPLQTNQSFVFDQLITNIDRDIHCFNSVALAQKISKGNQKEHIASHRNGPHISNTSSKIQHPTKSIASGPLKDISNTSSTHLQLSSKNDKKWVRKQRPNFSPSDELLETSLGKRGALSSLENSQPLKRLAIRDDALPNSSP